jgi:hypothetical protein
MSGSVIVCVQGNTGNLIGKGTGPDAVQGLYNVVAILPVKFRTWGGMPQLSQVVPFQCSCVTLNM